MGAKRPKSLVNQIGLKNFSKILENLKSDKVAETQTSDTWSEFFFNVV